jgi:hypothetical protein
MTQTNPPRPKVSGTRNLKLLITTVSLTTTLSGWALLALSQNNTLDAVSASEQDTALQQPTAVETAVSTAVPPPTGIPDAPMVIIPPLSALPVRGLREIGNPVQQPSAAAQPQIVIVQPPSDGGSAQNGGGAQNRGGGGQGPAIGGAPAPAPAPAPQPKPQPKPKPVGNGHGSHP